MDQQVWNDRYAAADLVWSAEPNQFFADAVRDLPPGRALDLGTGEGRNAMWLAERGWDVTAVDFSDVAIEKARHIAARRVVRVTWVVADLLEYNPPQCAFDLVALVYIHLPAKELRKVVAAAVAALAPGGMLFVIGHDTTNLAEGYGGPQDPVLLFTPDEIIRSLEGLSVVRAGKVIRTVVTPDGERDAVDALVVAVAPGHEQRP